MKHIFRELVPEHKVELFKNYKYQGTDNSILYQKIFSPFCDYIVNNFVPPNIAFAEQSKHSSFKRSL